MQKELSEINLEDMVRALITLTLWLLQCYWVLPYMTENAILLDEGSHPTHKKRKYESARMDLKSQ